MSWLLGWFSPDGPPGGCVTCSGCPGRRPPSLPPSFYSSPWPSAGRLKEPRSRGMEYRRSGVGNGQGEGGGKRNYILWETFFLHCVYVCLCCDNLCLTKLITKRKKKKHTLTFNIKWKTKNLFKNESTANTKIKFNTRQLLPSHSPDNFCFSV